MPCWWKNLKRCNVIGEDKGIIVFSVENKKELMLFVLAGDSLKCLIRKPSDSFEFVFYK